EQAAGPRVILATPGQLLVRAASELETCTFSLTLSMPAPAGATDFGREVAVGDFNGNGEADLAVGSEGAVHVYLDPDLVNFPPLGPSQSLTSPDGSSEFGGTIAIGDFNDDGNDDLAVGDSSAEVDGKAGA